MKLAIRGAGSNKKRAANLLSISRPRIRHWLKALGLIGAEADKADEIGGPSTSD